MARDIAVELADHLIEGQGLAIDTKARDLMIEYERAKVNEGTDADEIPPGRKRWTR